MLIVVERTAKDTLTRQVWEFSLADTYSAGLTLWLHAYRGEIRPSTRHKFRTDPEVLWYRYDDRGSRGLVEQVPVPDEVVEEAKDRARASIEFKRFTPRS